MPVSNKSIVGKLGAVQSSAIRVDQARCAKVRNRNVECLKCAQACTSGCISLVDGELVVDSSLCVGCGTCATVCPTCALEARNPVDAELLGACERASANGSVAVVCSQLAAALGPLLAEGAAAQVVCLGRVDETLLCELVARGVETIALAGGECARCAQAHGCATARMVAEGAESLLRAWGAKASLQVLTGAPDAVLAEGVSAEEARAAVARYFSETRACPALEGAQGAEAAAQPGQTQEPAEAFKLPRVMKDGTLPHFLPDRRERLLDALSSLGEPVSDSIESRLWGCVVIDGGKCSSCRMCATFCPTGAIRKFDDEDGTMGVLHAPVDCVKCGSCRDICPEGAICLLDQVKSSYLVEGKAHCYVMAPRSVALDDPHQIINTMKSHIEGNVYER